MVLVCIPKRIWKTKEKFRWICKKNV